MNVKATEENLGNYYWLEMSEINTEIKWEEQHGRFALYFISSVKSIFLQM